ncbi:hypothetical protein B0T17DRAFT_482684 [Bombardia bombarda]|uniref:Uncharacterized protein n=1 Tax=Bombardia bombarda TaxID=252184 RepID=A0AA39XMK2_9PEZI|nr:hypothetical protein B0T17DRAFT_482684 [Bombardia bombarda]
MSRSVSALNATGEGNEGEQTVYAWVQEPNSRGTMSIVWNSLTTVFLCTWTVLCLNLPAEDESFSNRFWRKFRWMVLALSGPEFLLCFAIGQHAAAKRSVALFQNLGSITWTMEHGFFADMGGFVLMPSDTPKFPINSKQLNYLVSKGYVSIPEVSQRDITDRTKADYFAKFVTVFQTTWFLMQVVGRGATHLHVTTLELTAVAIVVCTFGTFYCWYKKPLDVEVPIIIRPNVTIAQILIEAGPAASEPYKQTPLDFVDDFTPSWSINVTSRFGIRTGPRRRPLRRLGNCRIPQLDKPSRALLFTITHIYGSMHLIGWNFTFPTAIEQLLWRIAAATIFATTFLFWAIDRGEAWYFDKEYLKWYYLITRKKPPADEKIGRDPGRKFHAPTWVLFAHLMIAACYTVARLYLFFEGFYGLRKLPASAFECVNWNQAIPHLA